MKCIIKKYWAYILFFLILIVVIILSSIPALNHDNISFPAIGSCLAAMVALLNNIIVLNELNRKHQEDVANQNKINEQSLLLNTFSSPVLENAFFDFSNNMDISADSASNVYIYRKLKGKQSYPSVFSQSFSVMLSFSLKNTDFLNSFDILSPSIEILDSGGKQRFYFDFVGIPSDPSSSDKQINKGSLITITLYFVTDEELIDFSKTSNSVFSDFITQKGGILIRFSFTSSNCFGVKAEGKISAFFLAVPNVNGISDCKASNQFCSLAKLQIGNQVFKS